MQQKKYGFFSFPVIAGALGFFVDIYDLLLFNITRRSSLTSLLDSLVWQAKKP